MQYVLISTISLIFMNLLPDVGQPQRKLSRTYFRYVAKSVYTQCGLDLVDLLDIAVKMPSVHMSMQTRSQCFYAMS